MALKLLAEQRIKLGDAIRRKRRKELGVSQQKASLAIGISSCTLLKLENCKIRTVSDAVLSKIEQFYKLKVDRNTGELL